MLSWSSSSYQQPRRRTAEVFFARAPCPCDSELLRLDFRFDMLPFGSSEDAVPRDVAVRQRFSKGGANCQQDLPSLFECAFDGH